MRALYLTLLTTCCLPLSLSTPFQQLSLNQSSGQFKEFDRIILTPDELQYFDLDSYFRGSFMQYQA